MRAAIALLALVAGIYAAHAFGLGEGNRFGRLGVASKSGTAGPPPPLCSNALDFSVACNSQYIPTL